MRRETKEKKRKITAVKQKITVVGIGPGSEEHLTKAAARALKESSVIISYGSYLELIKPFLKGKKIYSFDMREEKERAELALKLAEKGKSVAVISSGDAGIYGMGSLIFEYAAKKGKKIDIELIPGITAGVACSALLGAPLGNDFATLSMSNLLTPWREIKKRLAAACRSDFVLIIYNPSSSKRKEVFRNAIKIIKKYRESKTPVGMVKNAFRKGEKVIVTTLGEIEKLENEIDMLTTLIIGNSRSFIFNKKIITPRGYKLE